MKWIMIPNLKLIIWGTTEVGKTSFSWHLKELFTIEKKNSYKVDSRLKNDKDSFLMKGLIDSRLVEKSLINSLKNLDNDVKHLLIYRQNLFPHFLSWQHIESKYNGFGEVDVLNIQDCKNFIKQTQIFLSSTHKHLKENVKNLCVIPYEELFFDPNCLYKINNFLNVNITEKQWEIIQEEPKFRKDDERTYDMKFVRDIDIEKYNYKKNFKILKDIFCDEKIIL